MAKTKTDALTVIQSKNTDIVVKKKKKTSSQFKFQIYTRKVLHSVAPDIGISGAANACIVNLVRINVAKVMDAVRQIILRTNAKTVTARDVQTALRLVLPGELAKHAVSEGEKSLAKFNASFAESGGDKDESQPKKAIHRSARAGLIFSVTRIERLIKSEMNTKRKSVGASVFMAAATEYLCFEVLELAANAARDGKRARITPRHIKLAIINDEELNRLYRDTIMSGGVNQKIENFLIPSADDAVKKVRKSPAAKRTAAKKVVAKKPAVAKKSAGLKAAGSTVAAKKKPVAAKKEPAEKKVVTKKEPIVNAKKPAAAPKKAAVAKKPPAKKTPAKKPATKKSVK